MAVSKEPDKPTKKIDIYEADMPILEAFLKYVESERSEDGIKFAFKLIAEMADRLRAQDSYIKDRCERWRQAQLRRDLAFYG